MASVQKINKFILLILFLLLEFFQELFFKLLIYIEFSNLLLSLDSLSSKSFVGKKSRDSWSLVVLLSLNFFSDSLDNSLLNINVANSDFLSIFLFNIVRVFW